MFDKSQVATMIGQNLSAEDGAKIGKIGQVYLDDYRDEPEWVTVNTGLFGTKESFVPLAEATMVDGGVQVPYTKDMIKNAPSIEAAGQLTETDEQGLYEHYHVPYTTEGSTFADTSRLGAGHAAAAVSGQRADRDGDGVYDDVAGTAAGHDASGLTTDDAMTRSEERLTVGTERVQTGKARLRKWVETENVQVEVPIRTEKATLVSEPITEENRGQAFDGAAISQEEHVVTLNAEQPVVSVEAVPVERVRLDTQVEESTQTVGRDVRKERVALEDDTTTTDGQVDRK